MLARVYQFSFVREFGTQKDTLCSLLDLNNIASSSASGSEQEKLGSFPRVAARPQAIAGSAVGLSWSVLGMERLLGREAYDIFEKNPPTNSVSLHSQQATTVADSKHQV